MPRQALSPLYVFTLLAVWFFPITARSQFPFAEPSSEEPPGYIRDSGLLVLTGFWADSKPSPQSPPLAEENQPIIPPSTQEASPFGLGNNGREDGDWKDYALNVLREDLQLCGEDYHHYYTTRNLGLIGLGVAIAAPLANTSADESISNWYRNKIRNGKTDTCATGVSYAADLWIALPICMELAAMKGNAPENYRFDGGIWEWSHRSVRTMVVGVPPMVLLMAALGAPRPDRHDSHWQPGRDIHGVSGHTFMGAVPFLTAASMLEEDNCWKYPLIAGSFLTGWSRLNDDRHYFSQAFLGWWMAYLAVKSVDETQRWHKSNINCMPTVLPDGSAGIGVHIKF